MTTMLLASALAIGILIAIALQQAQRQAVDAETRRVMSYALDIVHRSDAATDQFLKGVAQLAALKLDDPCSARGLEAMRQIDVRSIYLQAFGRVENNRLECSSISSDGSGVDLGPVDFISATGTAIRMNVRMPFAPDERFIVAERGGYAAIIHKEVPIDVTTYDNTVLLGMFSQDHAGLMASRGHIKPTWISRLDGKQSVTFRDGHHVVAVVRSRHTRIAAIAAAPDSNIAQRVRSTAMLLMPVGLLAGIALSYAIVRLARRQRSLGYMVRTALRRDEFFLQYQPIVHLESGKFAGAEALIRWRRDGEIVRPDWFIPEAEAHGLMPLITERVCELVARDVGDLFQRHPDFYISINLSAADLMSSSTVDMLKKLMDRTGAKGENVVVEATEHGIAQADLATQTIQAIRDLGIRAAVDDFGIGYSSLSFIDKVPLDVLKIDRSFIETVCTTAPTSQVVHHIIAMGRDLRLGLVAEGVEAVAQARFLRTSGVEHAQGYLYAKPLPLAEVIELLERSRSGSDEAHHPVASEGSDVA